MRITFDPRAAVELEAQIGYLIERDALVAAARLKARCDETMADAIRREKQLKEWRRAWKVRLIETMNPEWRNLFDPATGAVEAGPADVARQRGERLTR